MKLLSPYITDNIAALQSIDNLIHEEYNEPVIYHCYWKGEINKLNLLSIKSLIITNIINHTNNKIILWTNNYSELFNTLLLNFPYLEYIDIREFNLENEIKDNYLSNYNYNSILNDDVVYQSDLIRQIILFKYGGVYFDLDMIFLRKLDPLYLSFSNELLLYSWADWNYPNNAFMVDLTNNPNKSLLNIDKIMKRGRGFGFQKALLTYNSDLDYLVLPYSWFDIGFLNSNKYCFTKCRDSRSIDWDFSDLPNLPFSYHCHQAHLFNYEKKSFLGKYDDGKI